VIAASRGQAEALNAWYDPKAKVRGVARAGSAEGRTKAAAEVDNIRPSCNFCNCTVG
jgi:hypothetical protein